CGGKAQRDRGHDAGLCFSARRRKLVGARPSSATAPTAIAAMSTRAWLQPQRRLFSFITRHPMNHRHSLSHPGTPTCKPTLVPIARLALGGFIALAVPLAHAQDMTPHNYWGASIGTSRAKSDDAGLATV